MTGRQTDGRTDRQTDRPTDRPTECLKSASRVHVCQSLCSDQRENISSRRGELRVSLLHPSLLFARIPSRSNRHLTEIKTILARSHGIQSASEKKESKRCPNNGSRQHQVTDIRLHDVLGDSKLNLNLRQPRSRGQHLIYRAEEVSKSTPGRYC